MSDRPSAELASTDGVAGAAGDATPRAPGSPTGTLFCLPTPLGPDEAPAATLPASTLAIAARLDCFVAESAKTARAFLKRVPTAHVLQQIEILELNEHTRGDRLAALLAPLLAGRDVGLVSEAGCPGVADPGAALIALAHAQGIRVVPMVGPSAILLALMGSGLDGQQFAFVGYVPAQPEARLAKLRALEQRSAREGETVLMIETPYRAQALFDALIGALAPSTRVSVATDLTLSGERLLTRSVLDWRRAPIELGKQPTVFGLLADRRSAPPVRGRGVSARPARR